MAVGIVKHNESATATASGVGNPVFIVGSSTGKDGIHGATFASEGFRSQNPNVRMYRSAIRLPKNFYWKQRLKLSDQAQ
ncbi:MAG: hypothetical protein R3A12_06400 [Ignavibacteria bacterium]